MRVQLGYMCMTFLSLMNYIIANGESVAIVSFQPSTHSNESMVKSNFERDAKETLVATNVFTLCFRYMTRFLSDFAILVETNQIGVGITKKYAGLLLRQWNVSAPDAEYRRVVKFCKPFEPGQWVSVCLRVKLQGNIQEVSFSQKGEICFHEQFLDGTFEEIYFRETFSLEDILGASDGNDPQNLQEIKIMQLHLWTSLLTNLEMQQFTNSCRNIQDIKSKDLLFNLDDIVDTATIAKLQISHDNMNDICKEGRSVELELAIPLRYNDAKTLCSNLGGKMVLDISHDFHYTVGDPNSCSDDPKYWIPVKLDRYSKGNNYKWSSDVEGDMTKLKWSISQPNTYGMDKCVAVMEFSGENYANDIDCDSPRCSVCEIPFAHTFYLRGPGPKGLNSFNSEDILEFFDRKYSLLQDLQTNTSFLVFEGQTGTSQITWYPSKKISTFRRYDNKELLPGKKILTVEYQYQPFGHYTELNWVWTQCNPKYQFTCWDGECISIEKRCDKKIDCKYATDEQSCELVQVNEDQYRMANAPRNHTNGNEKLNIYAWYKIRDVTEVNEPEMYFSLRFELWLKWTDPRLGYSNLRRQFYQNKLTKEKANQLWKPMLELKNSVKNVNLDLSSSEIFLKPSGSCWPICDLKASREAPLQDFNEAKVYASNETEIIWRGIHLMQFKCHFDLYYLPFDHQTCYVEMEVPLLEKDQIQPIPWGLNLTLLTRTLNKHIITSAKIENNGDKLNLVIHLERHSGPFWFSLFIPSICLVLAAEVTLFINETYFEALIVVALTSNLVTYNLYNSVHELLPQVSSLKLIDIWLLHGLVMPMVVFITLVANEMINSKETAKFKSVKVGNSAVRTSGQNDKETAYCNKIRNRIFICKAAIPTISGVFILSFFMICIVNGPKLGDPFSAEIIYNEI